MKKYFRKSENYTPNPDYNVDLSVSGLTSSRMFLMSIGER